MRKKILIIEDNNDIRENMAEILELAGYETLTAANGKTGIAEALQHIPDLIVCDIMMPEVDGYGVIHALQKHDTTQNIPFIFLTAKAERAEVRKGMELGADDYLTKPFSSTELLNAIESRLKKNEQFRQHLLKGLEGLNELVISVSGKNILDNFKEDRNILRVKKKQLVYTEGNRPLRMFYIHKGKIKTYVTNDDGKELVTNIYSEGEFFGFNAIIEETNHKETAETLEESELATIPSEDFKDLLNSSHEVLMTFVQLLANNITERTRHLLDLAYSSLRKKLANALLNIASKYEDSSKFKISREDLANFTGSAKESVIRTLSDFKDEKLIDIKDGEIVILDMKKLQKMLN